MFVCRVLQGYGWLKDRILGEEGRRQQMQLRELGLIAEQLGCTLAQLAIGHCVNCRPILDVMDGL